MRATSLFSLRRTLLPQTLPGILLCLLPGAWGFRWVLIVFNPPDLNHLLIINRSGHELVTEGVADLEGEVDWQVRVPYIRRGDRMDTVVTIINIEQAWFSGTFRIKDGEGRILAENEISPPGRYCGTLVVTLDSDAKLQFAFNEIPESR
jgi:hypothetical protein